MQTSYSAAVTDSTAANRLRQTRTYLSFMLGRRCDPYFPTLINILLYIQLLANSFKSVATVKYYLSGAKTFLTQQATPTHFFSSPVISNLFKGLQRFATFLRQSNLLPHSATAWHSPHTLRRRDIYEQDGYLWVTVNSSKTITDPLARVAIPVAPSLSEHCPVMAWRQYVRRVPLDPDASAFMFSPHLPVTRQRLTSYLRASLAAVSFDQAHKVTVHSFRHSGAQECARWGASQQQLMQHGTCTSLAINNYVPLKLYTQVPIIMARMFGHR